MISIPFRGSKKYSYKQIKKIVKENGYTRALEPFGGTGVLSVNLFNDGLVDEAVINDYDHMFDIYPDFLDIKDAIVKECEEKGLRRLTHNQDGFYYLDDNNQKVFVKKHALSPEHKKILREVVSKYDKKYWPLLATGSCFVHNAAQNKVGDPVLNDFAYFRSRLDTIPARKYLEVVNQCTITNLDYKDFLETQEIDRNSLLIIDPPYIDTNIGIYKNETIFDYNTTSELIKMVKNTGADFIFFNYGKEQIENLLEENGLKAETIEYTSKGGYVRGRISQDVMAYVRNF